MMTPQERYQRDPMFAALVNQFYRMFEEFLGTGAGVTPTEVREASGLAWQIYVERNPPMIEVTG